MGIMAGQIDVGNRRVGMMIVRPGPVGLAAARKKVRLIAQECNFDRCQSIDLQVATGEAISNAYLHGTPDPTNGKITLAWTFANNILTIAISDEGNGFHTSTVTANKNDRATYGHGLRLMRACVDEVDFRFGDGATVILRKRAC